MLDFSYTQVFPKMEVKPKCYFLNGCLPSGLEKIWFQQQELEQVQFSLHMFVLLCVTAVTFNLQEDSFWPRAVRTAWIRKKEATGNQQEHDDEDWAETSQDPLSAPYQVDEMQLRQTEK